MSSWVSSSVHQTRDLGNTLVPHCSGAGTTGASLRAGKPTIIKPFFGDQAFWAERVESLRVGLALRKMTVATLAHALNECTQDNILVESARRLGQHIRQENGVATAIEAIYRDLDYARSLIKRDTHLASKPSRRTTDPASVGHEGVFSDGSSGWDILSERTSSPPILSEDEADASSHPAPKFSASSDDEAHAIPTSPLRRSASQSLKRTLSRAHSILPGTLLARRCSSRTTEHPREGDDTSNDNL